MVQYPYASLIRTSPIPGHINIFDQKYMNHIDPGNLFSNLIYHVEILVLNLSLA